MLIRTFQDRIPGYAAGLLCAMGVVALASGIQGALPSASLGLGTIAFLLGLTISSAVRLPGICEPGLRIATKPLLRIAIVLLGLQMTADMLLGLGWPMILALIGVIGATLVSALVVARLVKAEIGLTLLVAVGSAICGASAIMAVNQVVRRSEGQVAYAIACVTIFGTVSILILPAVGRYLGMTPDAYAIWVGASVHEVAQVLAAADRGDMDVSALAIAVKLARVVMLPVLIWLLTRIPDAHAGPAALSSQSGIPGFVFGYLGCVIIASAGILPVEILVAAKVLTGLLLGVSLAAIGLQTDVRTLKTYGWRPLAVAAAAWLAISVFGILATQMKMG